MKQINLSPSFLSKVLSKGYDYAVAEKLGMIAKDNDAMSAGKALHSFLSGSFGGVIEDIAISPYSSFRTKEAREWRDSQPDRTIIIKEDEAELYKTIVDRVKNHPEVKKLLEGAKIEPEKRVEKKVNGYTVKGFLDLVATKGEAKDILDWKFVSSQVFDDFGRKALWQHYDLQASVYDFLTNATHIFFVVIENEAPHRIMVWHCDSSVLESGADKFDKALKILNKEKWREPTFDILGVYDLKAWGY